MSRSALSSPPRSAIRHRIMQNIPKIWRKERLSILLQRKLEIMTLETETMKRFLTLRDKPELKEEAAEWFSSKWSVPKEAYLECMDAYLNHQTELGWYLCVDGDKIISGLGVIENDFHNRKDLSPMNTN